MKQDAIILTQFDPIASSPGCLAAVDHLGGRILFQAGVSQRVNILALQQQLLPCVVLVDGLQQLADFKQVSADSMISILPMTAGEVDAVLQAGAADKLLRMARGESA
ncbi:hypothetical protein [Pontibacterium sp.]|uniref:hypothetical protein n=1 Tax=Pontibacterium sp. TaxID=2036026 RepID=UPI0035125F97